MLLTENNNNKVNCCEWMGGTKFVYGMCMYRHLYEEKGGGCCLFLPKNPVSSEIITIHGVNVSHLAEWVNV